MIPSYLFTKVISFFDCCCRHDQSKLGDGFMDFIASVLPLVLPLLFKRLRANRTKTICSVNQLIAGDSLIIYKFRPPA